jgi:hypothetical protein
MVGCFSRLMFGFLGLDSFFVVVGCFSKWLFGFLGLDSFCGGWCFLGSLVF